MAGGNEIREFDGRRHAFPRVVHRGEAIQPFIGHLRDPDNSLGLPRRSPCRVANAGHELKEGGLAAGTEADESSPKHRWRVRMVAREHTIAWQGTTGN